MATAAKKAAASAPAASAPEKTAARPAAKKAAAKAEAEVEAKPDKVATHDVIRPIVIAGSAKVAGDGVTLSALDAAVLYNEGYVRRH